MVFLQQATAMPAARKISTTRNNFILSLGETKKQHNEGELVFSINHEIEGVRK